MKTMLIFAACLIIISCSSTGPTGGFVIDQEPDTCYDDMDCEVIRDCCEFQAVNIRAGFGKHCECDNDKEIYSAICISGRCQLYFEESRTCDNIADFSKDVQADIEKVRVSHPGFSCG
jgi:hypothetical protein